MNSLRIVQDFLRGLSLSFGGWVHLERAESLALHAGRVCGCHDHDSRCLHNNWIPKLLVSAVCAGGVDTRPAGQVGKEEG
jgi:hypothetical protein